MKLSKYLENMKYENGIECMFCGEKTKHGGLWGSSTVGKAVVCNNCQGKLIEFLIDTLDDTRDFNLFTEEEKLEYITTLNKKVLMEKHILQKNK